MNTRKEKKQASLEKILEVASVHLREEGIGGAAIAPVMEEAGLTHGAFYSHFANKEALAQAAFKHALGCNQPGWFADKFDNMKEPWAKRLKRMARSYLKPAHRDRPGTGCVIAALAADVPRAPETFQRAYEQAIDDTLRNICQFEEGEMDQDKYDEAIAFFAMCVGGLNLARGVKDKKLSDRILQVCQSTVTVE